MVRILLSLFISGFILSGCNSETPYPLKNFPTDFTQLTKTDSGLVVLNTCELGNLQIKITDASLLLHGTQEDYDFQILKSTIDKSDTIRLYAKNSASQKEQIFRIKNKDKNSEVYYWVTKYPSENDGALSGNVVNYLMVNDKNLNTYQTIKEPCENEEY